MIIILAPGPSVLFVIARAIAWGKKTSVLTVLGNVLGSFVLSTLVALGVGPVLERYNLAYIAVQWAGGLYLIYLGLDAIKKRSVHASDMTNQGPVGPTAFESIRDGFWVGALNPKAIVFFAAVLPQFIDIESDSVTLQLFFLGLTCRNCAHLALIQPTSLRKTPRLRWVCHDCLGSGHPLLSNCQ